jgi:hypothetical protein
VTGVCTCEEPLPFRCGDLCKDTRIDPDNCGGCATLCSGANLTGRACVTGACQGTCNSAEGDTWDDCINGLQLDGCETSLMTADNCGSCGNVCPDIQTCQYITGSYQCACPVGQTWCTDHCADLTASNTDCGGCGTGCNTDQECVADTHHATPVCLCDANKCDNGCCDSRTVTGGTCVVWTSQTTDACGGTAGSPGVECIQCVAGRDCAPISGNIANGMSCKCDATSCPHGCCDFSGDGHGVCVEHGDQSSTKCGHAGASCTSCSGSSCDDDLVPTDGGPPVSIGGICGNCDAIACGNLGGCCYGTTSHTTITSVCSTSQTPTRCGGDGDTCTDCTQPHGPGLQYGSGEVCSYAPTHTCACGTGTTCTAGPPDLCVNKNTDDLNCGGCNLHCIGSTHCYDGNCF